MALYAYDSEGLIAATDAVATKQYWCAECRLPVKIRRGRQRIAHFYHLQLSPFCRTHSKSEDHLLLQLQIQHLLPKNEAHIERIFPEISRVSDVVWEKEKLIFEIQCSLIYPKEVQRRIEEYKTLGYTLIWILDDRIYNKKILRPSEAFLRRHHGYFAGFRQRENACFYDQFEICQSNRRIKKSKKLSIDLSSYRPFPPIEASLEWPQQILNRIKTNTPYFRGDLLHLALQSSTSLSLAHTLKNWAALEKEQTSKPWRQTWEKKFKHPLTEHLNDWLCRSG